MRSLIALCALVSLISPLSSARVAPSTVRTLGMVIRYADDPQGPVAPTYLAAVLFTRANGVAAFWKENSYGATQVTGTVFPQVIQSAYPKSSSRCYLPMAQEAKAAVIAAGVDLSQYDRFVIIQSGSSYCAGKGLGGGSDVIMNGVVDPKYIAHELGHTLGLPHAAGVTCPTDTLGMCSWQEYGNPADVMSNSRFWQSNAAHKELLGYLNGRIHDHAGGKATYLVRPLESADGVVAIRVAPPGASAAKCSLNGGYSGPCLWIEYRQPLGYFDKTGASEIVAVLYNGATINLTGVVKTSPKATMACVPCELKIGKGKGATYWEQTYGYPLVPGASYYDAMVRANITVDKMTPEAITVSVEN